MGSPTTRRFLSGSYSSPQRYLFKNIFGNFFLKKAWENYYVSLFSPKQEVSVALAGPLGCGKSALAVRYLARRFIGEYDPKLGNKKTHIFLFVKMKRVDFSIKKIRGHLSEG